MGNAGSFRRRCALLLMALAVSSASLWSQSANNQSKPAPASSPAAAQPDANAVKLHDDTYKIGADDVLAINVWKEPDISRSVPVRSDGKISLPLAGEIQAAGQTPKQLEGDIAKKLASYISDPDVTVIVQQVRSQKFNILGQVGKPGSYPLTGPTTILDAIALAGGFKDFAKQKSIYVLRETADGKQTRLPFNYKEVIKGNNADQNIQLQPRDTIVVP